MDFEKAKKIISKAKHIVALTGAGISVESGIPPFRGENGIWNKYDAEIFDISFFRNNPQKSWELLKKVFFEVLEDVKPNDAHYALAELEKNNLLKMITTQNIDNLHFLAGNRKVIEFHGNTRNCVCQSCGFIQSIKETSFDELPPLCSKCSGILKPDFIFFGEPIPVDALTRSFNEFGRSDVVLIIGTTGTVYPAAQLPFEAKNKGAVIIEINTEKSSFTESITDIFLQGKASEITKKIIEI
jgi:NAD-dependent deacetylase